MAKKLEDCPILNNLDILLPFGIAVLHGLGVLAPGDEPTRAQLDLLEVAAAEAERENEEVFKKLKEAQSNG